MLFLNLRKGSVKGFILILLFLSLGAFQQLEAALVNIPDANFRAWLVTNLPSCMVGSPGSEQLETTCADIASTTFINVNNQNISSLEGIQHFTSLLNLNCDNNLLSSLPTLPTSLTNLSCRNNFLSSLPSIHSGFQVITCSNNNLSSIPSLPAGFQELVCQGNNLSSLPGLPSSMIELNCSSNSISSLPGLPSNLVQLDCSSNLLTSIPSLPLTLTNLICNNNDISSLPIPSPFGALNVFLCQNNQLDFGDLEPYVFFVPILFADPQANFDIVPSAYVGTSGDNISIDGTISGANNLYEWFKDGLSLGPPSSSGVLNLNSVTTADAGIYTLRITNTLVFSFSLPEVESNPIIVNIDGFLPIDLLRFEARLNDQQKVQLTWVTQRETNNAFFTLEKSDNARDFEFLGQINSQGNGNGRQVYEVTDEKPFPGFNYYRLSQTDRDGTVKTFPIVFVLNEPDFDLEVFPNPTRDQVFIRSGASFQSEPMRVNLMDSRGLLVASYRLDEAEQSISLKALSNGQYYLRLQQGANQKVFRVIKK